MKINDLFRRFATATSIALGSPWAFLGAVAAVVVWALLGPSFGFSDHWQLFINTGTTILTFLMVFLIQNTQNRDAKTLNIKLDELLRAVEGARTGMVNLNALSDEQLLALERELEKLGEREGLAPVVARREAARSASRNVAAAASARSTDAARNLDAEQR